MLAATCLDPLRLSLLCSHSLLDKTLSCARCIARLLYDETPSLVTDKTISVRYIWPQDAVTNILLADSLAASQITVPTSIDRLGETQLGVCSSDDALDLQ